MKIILIMGLPGSGKTTLAKKLIPLLKAKWVNADKVRTEANDWDFSIEGRKRQAERMKKKAKEFKEQNFNVIVDFVCPTPETRKIFNPDFIVWMDTIEKGRFDDTNKLFVKPSKYNVRVTEKNSDYWSKKIAITFKNE